MTSPEKEPHENKSIPIKLEAKEIVSVNVTGGESVNYLKAFFENKNIESKTVFNAICVNGIWYEKSKKPIVIDSFYNRFSSKQ